MDTAQQPTTNIPPWKEPHTPISEAEMSHPDDENRGRNTLLTLASLLVLAGIVGITLWLYIQNKSSQSIKESLTEDQTAESNPQSQEAVIPTLSPEKIKEKYGEVVCRRFTSLEDALQAPEITCTLDLSGQNLSELPRVIARLTNLSELDLSNNNFTEFPSQLFSIKSIQFINLKNNKIKDMPDQIDANFSRLHSVELDGNPLSNKDISSFRNLKN